MRGEKYRNAETMKSCGNLHKSAWRRNRDATGRERRRASRHKRETEGDMDESDDGADDIHLKAFPCWMSESHKNYSSGSKACAAE